MDLLSCTIKELSKALSDKKISSKEVCQFFLDRAQKYKNLNAFVTLNENILAEAEEVDRQRQNGQVFALGGIPMGVKDMFCTKGLRTTAGSKMLESFIPPYDATSVLKLKNSGALILGKLNQDEFAMGSSNETSYFGATLNPWDVTRVPGGSSGGSAASQAANLAPFNLGTDTGGSIRQPASFCGVVGIKPTYGRISRYGMIAYASSLDQAGVFANSVEDAAFVLELMCGFDSNDGTTSQNTVPHWSNELNSDMKGVRVGLLDVKGLQSLDADVQKTLNEAAKTLEKQGAEIVPIQIHNLDSAVSVYYLVASSEASSNLARYDGVRYGHRAHFENLASISLEEFYSRSRQEGFGPEVRRRIMLGAHCLSSGYYDAYYIKASQVRRLLTEQYLNAFQSCDVILSPVTATPAFKLNERITDPLTMYLNDIFTTSINLAGLPAMSLPFGISNENLPIGVQLIASHFAEQKIFNVALALQKLSPVKGRKAYE